MSTTPAAEEPAIAQTGPYKVELLAGYRYAWCACGLSKWQPFCDGSHTGSKVPGIKPVAWTQETRFGIAFVDEIDPALVRGPGGVDATAYSAPRYTKNHQAVPISQQADASHLRKI